MERGRPRIFDEEQALDAALVVFWRNGYQSASLEELTRAMGINKPSMYATFGNKEKLYLRALERYRDQQVSKHASVMATEPQLKQAMRIFLRSVVYMLTSPELPGGCMVVNSAVVCDVGALPKSISDAIGRVFEESTLGVLKERLKSELRQRNLPKGASVDQLADYFTVIMSGMAVMAKMGVTEKRLFKSIELALDVLPEA